MATNTKSAHGFDVRFKILYLFVFSILVFIVPDALPIDRILALSGMLIISGILAILFYFHSKHAFAKSLSNYIIRILKSSIPVYILCFLTFFFNALRITDSGLSISETGMNSGIFYALRIAYLVWISLSVIYTTTSRELVLALRSLLSPLKALGLRVDDLALTISIALRFIPEMMSQYKSILESQWCRGAKTDSSNVFVSVKSHVGVILPLMIRVLSKVDDYALALIARGWRG